MAAYSTDLRKRVLQAWDRGMDAESVVHARVRKIIKTRGHFPTDEAAIKLIWLALRNITAEWVLPTPLCPIIRSGSSKRLRRTIVVVQHAADPLVAANLPVASRSRERLNQLVTDTLMVPLAMVVRHELGDRAPKMRLPQQDYAL